MSKKSRRSTDNIFEAVAVYVVTPNGPSPIARPPGSTNADAWRDLRDVGRRLSQPPQRGETLQQYARRLRAYLSRFDRHEYIQGALVAMLLHIVNLDCPHAVRRDQSPATSSKD